MTTRHTVALADPLPVALADELARRVYFLDERIVDFTLVVAGDAIRGLELTTDRPVPTPELARKAAAVVTGELGAIPPEPAVRWRSARADATARPVFADLVRAGLAIVLPDGQVAVGGALLRIIDRLDAVVRDIAIDEFGAAEYRYPALLRTETLRRCAYLASFPQHVMYVTRLRADLDTYQSFTHDITNGVADGPAGLDRLVLDGCDHVEHCLPPTVCHHVFQQLADTTLAGEATTVTATGKCFRFEGRYQNGLERLWNFTMRELVFLGPRRYVIDRRERFLDRMTGLFDAWGLAGRCEVANDPFFGRPRTGQIAAVQRTMQLKYETRLAVAADRTVAVASFNMHDQTFGTAFDIRLPDGTTAASGCAGVGLERLAYAIVCQYGIAEAGWPAGLRTS